MRSLTCPTCSHAPACVHRPSDGGNTSGAPVSGNMSGAPVCKEGQRIMDYYASNSKKNASTSANLIRSRCLEWRTARGWTRTAAYATDDVNGLILRAFMDEVRFHNCRLPTQPVQPMGQPPLVLACATCTMSLRQHRAHPCDLSPLSTPFLACILHWSCPPCLRQCVKADGFGSLAKIRQLYGERVADAVERGLRSRFANMLRKARPQEEGEEEGDEEEEDNLKAAAGGRRRPAAAGDALPCRKHVQGARCRLAQKCASQR